MALKNVDTNEVTYPGAVLEIGQRYVGFDYDVERYALCWDDATRALVEVTLSTTWGRSTTHYAADVDATPDVRVAAVLSLLDKEVETLRRREWQEFCADVVRAYDIDKGTDVIVVSGRKVPVGATGRVVWLGETQYGPRVGIGVPGLSGAVFTAKSNVRPLDVDTPDWTTTRLTDDEMLDRALDELAHRFKIPADYVRAAISGAPLPPVHTIGGKYVGAVAYGTVHDPNCPACAAAAAERTAHRVNPHRPGTKAHAKWEREQSFVQLACDPRSETYWSM